MKTAAISMETGSARLGLADGATKTAMKLQCLKVGLTNKKSIVVSCGTVILACSNLLHLRFSHQYQRSGTALDFHV